MTMVVIFAGLVVGDGQRDLFQAADELDGLAAEL